ncbi:SDR family oxidoreductase [Flavobacterium sp. AC]|uniref:SDR family oxidoreductase n=1 Tax=Flavobacterium azizsancarii TaxID=2961580 RepID=A0ABT4W762_9FLAO|nr:SDR family oxidoreductase [Flavobacterium azizsancarii]MDA6068352.1 SDR family oxidoreductase [Flavobacterium azizsancarii]
MKKVIFVTGASSGLGKATSLFFAQQGWNVIATMRNPEKETELKNLSNVFVTRLDVSDLPSITTAISEGIEKFGHIDALINNAGYGQQGLFEAISAEKIREQFEVNVFGLMDVTRAILPHFRNRKQGTIVNVTSGVGRITVPLVSVYAASKFAIEGFSESLSYELESQNIKVKIIEPGYVPTSFHERAATDFAFDPALEDYKPFQDEMNSLFSSFENENIATPSDVAKIIYGAVTDQSHTLRYIAGPDLEPMIALRNSKSDQEYMKIFRNQFMPEYFK